MCAQRLSVSQVLSAVLESDWSSEEDMSDDEENLASDFVTSTGENMNSDLKAHECCPQLDPCYRSSLLLYDDEVRA